MTDDLFGLPAGEPPPLDMGGMVPQPQAPQSPQPKGGTAKSFAPLLALLPVAAARGGRAGVAALLQGFLQARQQREAQQGVRQQQDAITQRQLAESQALAAYRQQTLEAQQAQRRMEFVTKFQTAVQEATSAEQAKSLLAVWGPAAQQLGIRPDALQAYVLQTATPTSLERRTAQTKIAELDKIYGDAWRTGTDRIALESGEQVTPADLLARAAGGGARNADGQAMVPTPPVRPTASSVGSTEQQHLVAVAQELGKPVEQLTAAEREQARRRWMQSDDRPVASGGADGPTVGDNRRFTMEQRLAAQWDKAETPFREMRRQLGLMEVGLRRFTQGDKNGGSQAVLLTFQKILDPTSVVRESEYARSASGISMIGRFEGYLERLTSGGAGVPAAELSEMVETARQFLRGMDGYNNGLRGRLTATAQEYRLDPRMIFNDTGEPAAAPAPTAPRSAPATGNPFRR